MNSMRFEHEARLFRFALLLPIVAGLIIASCRRSLGDPGRGDLMATGDPTACNLSYSYYEIVSRIARLVETG